MDFSPRTQFVLRLVVFATATQLIMTFATAQQRPFHWSTVGLAETNPADVLPATETERLPGPVLELARTPMQSYKGGRTNHRR